MSIRFAHLADCHLGSWSSHPELKEKPLEAFEAAVDTCIREDVDFIIIAGDLLDTSLPGIDVLRRTAAAFRKCKEAGITVYIIAGSHDYSPTGKTMLSVFEDAGLVVDVAKYYDADGKIGLHFTTDEKTGAKIAGIFGRKGSLEAEMFERISVEEEPSFKIFVFHSGVDEQNGISSSLLPKGFDYYATGHIHLSRLLDFHDSKIAFPGPLFPTSFDELENYNSGFYLVDYDGNLEIKRKIVKLFDVVLIEKDANNKTPSEIEDEILKEIDERVEKGCMLLVKIHGLLKSGKPGDIDFKTISGKAESLGAFSIKKNLNKLSSSEMEEVATEATSIDELEKNIIAGHAEKMKLDGKDVGQLVVSLMDSLKEEKGEDETNSAFEEKIKENAKKLIGI